MEIHYNLSSEDKVGEDFLIVFTMQFIQSVILVSSLSPTCLSLSHCFICFDGHTSDTFRLTPGSVLRYNSWNGSRSGWLCAWRCNSLCIIAPNSFTPANSYLSNKVQSSLHWIKWQDEKHHTLLAAFNIIIESWAPYIFCYFP